MKKSIILLILISKTLFASVQKDLEKAFDSLNYKYNVTSAYKSQQAGFYTGGSIYARNQIRNQQIAYINLPKISSGCGGIDIYTGGLSFITKDEAVELGRNILSSAGSYAFNLALESMTPLIANTMKDLSRKVTDFTNQSINSCETAVGLVGSIFPKTEEAQRSVCQSAANGDAGIFGGLAEARMGCKDYETREKAFSRLRNKKGYEHQLLGSMNFAWRAIQDNPLFKGEENRELAELMMSLSGTVIYQDKAEHGGAKKQQLPSLATNNEFINTLMLGGQLKIYGCNDDDKKECLKINTNKYITIKKEESFLSRVENRLKAIVDKIRGNLPLDDKEVKFIQSTNLPVYKMLNVQSAFTRGLSTLDVTTYTELIATDMLYYYLEETMQDIITKAKALQLPEAEFREFISSIEHAKQNIRNRKMDTNKQRLLAIQMIEQTMQIEKRLALNLQSSIKDSLTWADGI